MLLYCLIVFFLGWLFGLGFFVILFHMTTFQDAQNFSVLHQVHENAASIGVKTLPPVFVPQTPALKSPVTSARGFATQIPGKVSVETQPTSVQSHKSPRFDVKTQSSAAAGRETVLAQINGAGQTRKTSTVASRGAPGRLHKAEPWTSEITQSEGGNELWIYLDWPYDDRTFTAENYRSLETFLNIYPKALFRILLTAPYDAYVHKIGNQLSTTHFTKYQRRGYDIAVVPVAMMPNLRPQIAMEYRDKWLRICCRRCNGRCRNSDHVMPFHLLMYIRLVKLFRMGGIFSDFTWLLHGHLQGARIMQGFQLMSHCSADSSMTMWQEEQQRNMPGKWRYHGCFTSVALVFNMPHAPVIECVLQRYDDAAFVKCVESDTELGGALCIKLALNECFAQLKLTNDLEAVSEVFDRTGRGAAMSLTTPGPAWSVSADTRLLWMGAKATSAFWPHDAVPEKSLLDAILEQVALHKLHFEHETSACTLRSPCSPYHTSLSLLNEFRKTSYETGIEQASCAPAVVVPGFMKSASTFLFSAISKHPQVLPPLKGAQMKETYCYHASPLRKLMKRPWCFPFVEPGENFVTSDGTVYYATNPSVPYTLKQDNPNVKVVFAVRHPADRFYSNYKFSFDTYGKKGSMDDLINLGTHRDDKFGKLRDLVTSDASIEQVIEQYYNGTFKAGGALAVLFMHSIAFPAIAHYQRVLGKGNVMVVSSDQLSPRNMSSVRSTLNDVFSFLGLCPYDIPDMEVALPGKNVMPAEKELSQQGYRRLNTFFKPFHAALGKLVGWDLSNWDVRQPKKTLPATFNGMLENIEKTWYE